MKIFTNFRLFSVYEFHAPFIHIKTAGLLREYNKHFLPELYM